MAVYPFITTPAQATATAVIQTQDAIVKALVAAVIAQLNNQAASITIDAATLNVTINTLVQGVATDTNQTVIHPVTGQPVTPVAVVKAGPTV